jgi:prepilin-type N-terminal cleavage/methylation domain-containing protein
MSAMRHTTAARAFTLIELMIVVAIIGILASLAIPNYVKFQCRAKQSEVKGNMHKIAQLLNEAIATNGPPKTTLERVRVQINGCDGTRNYAMGNAQTDMITFAIKGKSRYIYDYQTKVGAPYWDLVAVGCSDVVLDDSWVANPLLGPGGSPANTTWRIAADVDSCK